MCQRMQLKIWESDYYFIITRLSMTVEKKSNEYFTNLSYKTYFNVIEH